MTENPMQAALQKTRPQPKTKKEKVHNAYATPKRRGKRGYTIYLDTIPHGHLKDIASDEDCTLESLTIEGLNYVLQKRGKPVIA